MKYCQNCNMECRDTMNYCPACGAAVENEVQSSEYETIAFPRPQLDDPGPAEKAQAERAPAENTAQPNNAQHVNTEIPRRIENHLVKAIIATVCCCLPFGIVAIVYAAKVNPMLMERNFEAALDASRKASLWGNLSIGLWVLFTILWTIFYTFIFSGAFVESFIGNYLNGIIRLGS